jgi:very-short-patch-repair endonuclease
MRREMTEAEHKLWRILRNRSLVGVKFRRQVPIGNYIADFCCLDLKLVVEVDGGQHAEREVADASRSRFLREKGFRVLRFWNDQALRGSEFVVAEILAAISENERAPSPVARGAQRPLPKGEV